ncbi:MAG: LysM peptidoglycan-binding domain-containing protein [Clostridia bacterium]|nr:LysM peptidoglycan-binding domain-containing protein [Clostridia bacterium]
MKIKNMKKFLRAILIIIGAIIFINLIIPKNILSHQQISNKTVVVCDGDTLWSIAKLEQNNNSYYDGKDIREIVQSIKKINNLSSANLKINQTLQIPTY